jgi:OOP family OmpA-OmpF porin
MHRSLLPALLLCLAACVTVPEQEPFAVDALVPGARERVVVNQAFVLADVSASMNAGAGFAEEKALIRSFVAAMPEGSYAAAALAFGGESRRSLDLDPFERDALQGWADRVPYFGQATPFPAALAEVKRELAGQGGRAALIVFSDGLPNQHGMIRSADASLAAARTLAETHGGTVCIYTVQIGNDPEGTAFMKALAHATPRSRTPGSSTPTSAWCSWAQRPGRPRRRRPRHPVQETARATPIPMVTACSTRPIAVPGRPRAPAWMSGAAG